jgi:uncharacterized protein (TIGR02246 family)
MTRTLTLTLAALAVVACLPRAARQVNTSAADDAAVRQVEEEIIAAENHGDAATFERLLAPDWTFVNPGGGLFDKARYVRLVRTDSLHAASYTVDSMSVRTYGDAAVVVYRSSVVGTFAGRDITSRRRRTTVLVKRDGQWLVVAQQSTPIAGQ